MTKFVTLLAAIGALAVLGSAPGFACQDTTDCNTGSQCLKRTGQSGGICVGGQTPGNSNDRQPSYSPADVNHIFGNTCTSILDCGTAGACAKSAGQTTGVCLHGR